MYHIGKVSNRVSLVGGGTDYLPFVRKFGGAVVGFPINKYCRIQSRILPEFFTYKTRVAYSQVETVNSNVDIEHRVVREVIKYLDLQNVGLEIEFSANAPSKSGLGSSSSFIAALVQSLSSLKGERLPPWELREKTIFVEQNILKENVGLQDTALACAAGLNYIEFTTKGIFANPITLSPDRERELESLFLLLYTKSERVAHDIASQYVVGIDKNAAQVQIFDLVKPALKYINKYDWEGLGDVLYQAWELKKQVSPVISNSQINYYYGEAMACGAYGGKLLGAGGSGCLFFLAPPETHEVIVDSLGRQNVIKLDIKIDKHGPRSFVEE